MRKKRYLAPWRREGLELDLSEMEGEGEKMAEVLEAMRGKPAIYHCVSRVTGGEYLLGDEEKEYFVELMRRYERFSLVRVLTFCVMSNHFHILVDVPAAPEDRGMSWSDEEFLAHLGKLYSEYEMAEIRFELGHYREKDMDRAAEAMRERYFRRMWDLSEFMKGIKQCFTQWFNRRHGRRGCLWGERFKSSLVEDGHAARKVAAYIDLNPVRAGLVKDPNAYRWSGYGEAVAGKTAARDGLRLVMYEELCYVQGDVCAEQAGKELAKWREVVRRYRMILFEDGKEGERDKRKGRAGIAAGKARRELEREGRLSEGELLRRRVRYFLDGLALGSEGFVNGAFALSREFFGRKRTSGARKMRGVRTEMRTMRDLRKEAV